MEHLNIVICGCGNGAHACAALMGLQGHKVSIFSPLAQEIAAFKKAYAENGGLAMRFGAGLLSAGEGADLDSIDAEISRGIRLENITSDPEEVIPQAAVIFVIVPSFAHRNILKSIRQYLNPGTLLAFLPSRGGLEFELRAFAPQATVMAFQTLPWAARIREFGKEVLISARKKSIRAAAVPADISQLVFAQMERLLEMEIVRIRHMLTLTLSNMGQVIHPGIMYSIFKGDPFRRYPADRLPLFYQGIDEEGGDRLASMSLELQDIAQKAGHLHPDVEPEMVPFIGDWLMESYPDQITDASSVYRMFVTNKAYGGLKAPVKRMEDGCYLPDFSTRYIVEDIPYGLLVSKSIGSMMGADTPVIDEVILGIDEWTGYRYMQSLQEARMLSKTTRLPEFYGIGEASDLLP